MNLKKEFNPIKFNTLDLVKEFKYKREDKREFCKKFSIDSIKDRKEKKRT